MSGKQTYDDSSDKIVRDLRATFREEAYELLAELEHALLELEKDPGDSQQIGRVFRAMHTIKGSGGACEFHEIASFTHEMETILDRVRSGQVVATKEIINLTLMARDVIEAMFNVYYKGGSYDPASAADILAEFRKLIPAETAPRPIQLKKFEKSVQKKKHTAKCMTYRIRFKPGPDIFVQGIDPVNILNELRGLGTCKIIAHTDAIPYLEDFDHQSCYTYWDVILSTCADLNAIEDAFIFVKDTAEIRIDIIDEEGYLEDDAYKKLGEILLERGDITSDDLQKVLQGRKLVGEMLVEEGVLPGTKLESALVEQQHVRELREQRKGTDSASSIRVATTKLDTLVNLVGELVTVQARLSQTALNSGIPALLSISEEVERLTASLRDNTMNIRMLPIGTMFSKFKRVVRDLASELGKEIEMIADGAETELDKTVIERLSDPLVHIIRNSIGHGIERPEERTAAGKPRRGTIHLSASHSGAYVLIQIRDDGAGLDSDAIRRKAVEKGMLAADAEPGDKELFSLILMPDFSTAGKVTSVSGRGVGLDVVKKAIEALRGTIEITSSRGQGAMIILKIPLTLAIIDGFLTRIGEEHFIFELSSVQECIELNEKNSAISRNRNLVNVRGSLVPFIRLRDQFSISGDPPAIEQVVIVQEEERRVGFVVDSVVGEHQTVLKSLGRYYKSVEGISGATILGDGTVALVLDTRKMIESAELEEVSAASS